MFKLTGLWVNENKTTGEKYFGGNLGSARILVFKNKFKEEGSNEPDYNLYIDEQLKKEVPKVSIEDIPF